MSVDVNVRLFPARLVPGEQDHSLLVEKVFKVVEDQKLGICDRADKSFVMAGFYFGVSDRVDPCEEEDEDQEESVDYRPYVELYSSTNMGWGYSGDWRAIQFPVAHVLAQVLAMRLNVETCVFDPQRGNSTYYRRTDHPEVHSVIDNDAMSFSGDGYGNFVEARFPVGDGHGAWVPLGYKTARNRGRQSWE